MPANPGGVLLVGGCGYVGHLVALPLQVVYGTRQYTSFDPRECPSCPWCSVQRGDVCDLGQLYLAARSKDAIVYAAMRSRDGPAGLFDVHVRGFYNCLLVAKDLAIGRVVLVSSLSVYDKWMSMPMLSEVERPCCDEPYGVTKVLQENLAQHFAANYGMSVLSLRIACPLSEAEAAVQKRRHRNLFALTDRKLAEAIDAAVSVVDHQGFDAVHICGHTDPSIVNMEKAKRLLGWEP